MTTTNEKTASWTVSVDEEGVLVFPDELLAQLDWKENDLIEWLEQPDGSIILKKCEKSEDDNSGSGPPTSTIDARDDRKSCTIAG
jgi:bifunctional DNA-binding transcriptional regulator/antitoxin component of YhaV-PrlF toxin-antitoxin module